MKKNGKKCFSGIVVIAIFLALSGVLVYGKPAKPVNSTVAKTPAKKPAPIKLVLPQPVINGISSSYNKGEKISITVFSTDYIGKVQYRLVINRIGSKESYDLTKGYSAPVSSKIIYRVEAPSLFTEGKYNIIAYAKRIDSKSQYDKSYTKTFEINKDVVIKKNGQVYELPASSANLTGDIYITAENATLRNIKIKGNIIIRTPNKSVTALNNITANGIKIETGGKTSLTLNNVSVKSLEALTENNEVIGIKLTGSSQIENVNIDTLTYFDILDGAVIKKYQDINNKSNLAFNNTTNSITTDGAIVKKDDNKPSDGKDNSKVDPQTPITTPAAVTTDSSITTGSAVTTASAITTEPAVIVPPVIVDPPVVIPPSVPGGNQYPVLPDQSKVMVEYAGMLLSTSPNPIAFSGGRYSYSMDLSSYDGEVLVMRLCITVSKNCTLTMQGLGKQYTFNLTAHVQKQIKILSDLGFIDGGREGLGLVLARKNGNEMPLTGIINDGVNPAINVNLMITLK